MNTIQPRIPEPRAAEVADPPCVEHGDSVAYLHDGRVVINMPRSHPGFTKDEVALWTSELAGLAALLPDGA